MCIHKFREGQMQFVCKGYCAFWNSKIAFSLVWKCNLGNILDIFWNHSSTTHRSWSIWMALRQLTLHLFSHPFLSSLFESDGGLSLWDFLSARNSQKWLIVTRTQYVFWSESYIYVCFSDSMKWTLVLFKWIVLACTIFYVIFVNWIWQHLTTREWSENGLH